MIAGGTMTMFTSTASNRQPKNEIGADFFCSEFCINWNNTITSALLCMSDFLKYQMFMQPEAVKYNDIQL